MAKNKEHKEVLEIPEKVGFGTRDCYIVTETLDQKITYIKNGKGDEEIVFVIEEIKKKDPEAVIERGDKKLSVNLSRSFEVKTYKAPRQQAELSEREKNRLKDIIEAIAISELEDEYTEEELETKINDFPRIIKYYTDDENEEYYIKSEKEIWIEEDFFTNNANLLITLTEAYLKSKGITKEQPEYIQKFEDIAYNYI